MYKLGRLPRTRDPRVPHLSSLLPGRTLPPAPIAVDWTVSMPDDFGMMLNDKLGICTCAGIYHARQVWTSNASGTESTEPDEDVKELYEDACGYVDGKPSTDRGGNEQDVLTYLLNTGYPVTLDSLKKTREHLAAFIETDPRNLDDVKRVIHDCGGIYIGFEVPDTIWNDDKSWHTADSNNIIGGHAVWCAGYDSDGVIAISWGARYKMTWGFWARYVDECYALIDPSWITARGVAPCGLSLSDLDAAMSALKAF